MIRPKTPTLGRGAMCSSNGRSMGSQDVRAIQSEILRIQALRKDLLNVFEHPEFQQALRTIMDGKEIQAVDEFFAATKDSASSSMFPSLFSAARQPHQQLDFAFETIAQNCAREAASLSRGQVLISILGEMKAGKSTLCNAILGQNLLPVETAPCTSVNCIISSGTGSLLPYQPPPPEEGLSSESSSSSSSEPHSSPSSSSSSLSSSLSNPPVDPDLLVFDCDIPSSSTFSERNNSNKRGERNPRVAAAFWNPEIDLPSLLEEHEQVTEVPNSLSAEYFALKPLLLRLWNQPREHFCADERLRGGVLLMDVDTEFPLLSNLPPELRSDNIFSHLSLVTPILGLSEPGVCIADCPGVRESSYMTFRALHSAQRADIIVYVMAINILSIPDDTAQFLQRQMNNGTVIVFVFNRRDTDSDEGVARVTSALQYHLNTRFPALAKSGRTQIHMVNSKAALDQLLGGSPASLDPDFIQFQHALCKALQERAKGMVFHFSRAFFQLLRAEYVILSRFIGLGIKCHERKSQFQLSPLAIDVPLARLKEEILALMQKASVKIDGYRDAIKGKFLDLIDLQCHGYFVRAQHMRTRNSFSPDAAPKPWYHHLSALWKELPQTDFENELFGLLLVDFDRAFKEHFFDWIAEINFTFAGFLSQKASKIQMETSGFFSALSSDLMTIHSQQLFNSAEKQIECYGKEGATAMRLGIGVAGGAGAAAMLGYGTTFAIGIISSSVAVGGGVALAAVGLAGFVGAGVALRKMDKRQQREEATVRKDVVTSLADWLRSVVNTPEFDHMLTTALGACTRTLDYTRSSLLVSLFEVAATPRFGHGAVDYDSLCRYVYIREQLTDIVSSLSSILQDFDHREAPSITHFVQRFAPRYPALLGDKQSPYLSCSLCLRDYVYCGHLCPHCTVALDAKCPTCSKWEYLARRSDGSALRRDIEGHFQSVSDASSSSSQATLTPSDDDFVAIGEPLRRPTPQLSLPHQLEQNIQENYANVIESFTQWFNAFSNMSIDHAREVVELFFVRCYSLMAPDAVSESYRRLLIGQLHQSVIPLIYPKLLRLYQEVTCEASHQLYSLCAQLVDQPPAYFFSGKRDHAEPPPHPAIPQADLAEIAAAFAGVFERPLPLDKISGLTQIFEKIAAAGPHSLAADELVPYLIYIIVQVQGRNPERHICAHLAFCNDLLYQYGSCGLPVLQSTEVFSLDTTLNLIEWMRSDEARLALLSQS